jgi:hypothetical protein
VLPYWLANPDIAELDLLSEEVPVDDMEVKNYCNYVRNPLIRGFPVFGALWTFYDLFQIPIRLI